MVGIILWDACSVTCLTRRWGWLIEENGSTTYRAFECVACRASDLLVAASKGELRLVMVEEGRSPLRGVVTGRTVVASRAELACVRVVILVAGLAFAGCA